jgi:hypothetical protein
VWKYVKNLKKKEKLSRLQAKEKGWKYMKSLPVLLSPWYPGSRSSMKQVSAAAATVAVAAMPCPSRHTGKHVAAPLSIICTWRLLLQRPTPPLLLLLLLLLLVVL